MRQIMSKVIYKTHLLDDKRAESDTYRQVSSFYTLYFGYLTLL